MPSALEEIEKSKPPKRLGAFGTSNDVLVNADGIMTSRPMALWMIALGIGAAYLWWRGNR